jgi:predicted small secreted protein
VRATQLRSTFKGKTPNERSFRLAITAARMYLLIPARVEHAGMSTLREGQRRFFKVVVDRRTGKSAGEWPRAA